ncbi:MAG: hypothetical protein R3C02_25075 [Planctomycetaceae bacterium]
MRQHLFDVVETFSVTTHTGELQLRVEVLPTYEGRSNKDGRGSHTGLQKLAAGWHEVAPELECERSNVRSQI